MILTYKIPHYFDFSVELAKAKQIALFAVKNKQCRSSKDVKQFGLKSALSNQILKKYGWKSKAKQVKKIKLTVPSQSIKWDENFINIPCLNLSMNNCLPRKDWTKINQIEIGKTFAWVSVSVPEQKEIEVTSWLGVDLNTTSHCAVVGNPNTGKILKLGKGANHIHTKYSNMRRRQQKKGRFLSLKETKGRESRKVKDINHKISRAIVSKAKEDNAGIVMEQLTGIRNKAKTAKSFRYSLNSWSFYQLKTMIEYKAKLLGIPVVQVAPQYTSQKCSRCGLLGERNKKLFKCPGCGHVDHADVNASFNISKRYSENLLVNSMQKEMYGRGSLIPPEGNVENERPQP